MSNRMSSGKPLSEKLVMLRRPWRKWVPTALAISRLSLKTGATPVSKRRRTFVQELGRSLAAVDYAALVECLGHWLCTSEPGVRDGIGPGDLPECSEFA